jgi:XTP/dITP diphosphohydrolase
MITLLIATRNAHKVGEIRAILGDQYRYLTLSDLPNVPETFEDAGTFAGNASKKAVALASWLASAPAPEAAEVRARAATSTPYLDGSTLTFVLADDSGLEVDALNGAPGVQSARFAALDTGAPGNSATAANNAKLLRLLKEVPLEKRTARFRCVLALTPVFPPQPDSASPVCYSNEFELQTEIFDGVCEGRIILTPRGRGGFGYDPLFVPDGYSQTFGELAEHVKNQLSHRGRALAQLRAHLENARAGA